MLIKDSKQQGVLIVEDDPIMASGIKDGLTLRGHERVFIAKDGTEAVSILASQGKEIYLVTLDLKMPEMDGLGVMKHLTNVHHYPVGIIVVTGYGSLEDEVKFYKSGTDNVIAVDFVSKPFDFDKLMLDIEKTLEKIHIKRMQQLNISSGQLFQRIDSLESQLAMVTNELSEIRKELSELVRNQQGFLAQLGMELIKTLVIALAIISLIYIGGIDDFIRDIVQGIR